MLECTDRHFRYLMRLISGKSLLYTEMVTTGALLNSEPDRLLRFHPLEHPIAVQFGGNDPFELQESAKIAVDYGYDEINLNIGCPSSRVRNGRMGACLMAEPERVAECIEALCKTVSVPISVKTRIGIDHQDSYSFLASFIEKVARAGCKKFVIHARKALLSGLSPKQNRQIPPLCYDRVFRVKEDYPDLEIVLNGGITNLDQAAKLLDRVDGVMIGREVYKNPYLFAGVDWSFYGEPKPEPERIDVLRNYLSYMHDEIDQGAPISMMTRHLFGLFHARPGSGQWRRKLGELTQKKRNDAGVALLALASGDCS